MQNLNEESFNFLQVKNGVGLFLSGWVDLPLNNYKPTNVKIEDS